MRTRLATTLALVFGIFGSGMPAGGCVASNHPPYPDPGGFCTAYAKAVCQIANLCAIQPDACQTYQEQQCASANQAAMSTTRTYSPDNAKTCVDAVSTAYANAAQTSSRITFAQLVGPGSITDKCKRVFTGNVDALKKCTVDEDCSGDLVCARASPGSTLTVCATPHPVAQGQPCQDPGDQCDPTDSYCQLTQPVSLCAPAAMAGEACSDGMPCVSSQHCVGTVCMPRASADQPCLTNDDCGQGAPYCDAYFHSVCTTGLTFAGGAADCLGIGGLLPPGAGGGDAGSG